MSVKHDTFSNLTKFNIICNAYMHSYMQNIMYECIFMCVCACVCVYIYMHTYVCILQMIVQNDNFRKYKFYLFIIKIYIKLKNNALYQSGSMK